LRRTLLVIIFGLVVGAGLGIVAGWYWPLQPPQTVPAALAADWQADWILMTAEAYHLDGDLALARQRLQVLGPGNPGLRAAERGQQAIAEGLPPPYLGTLARLSAALGARSPALEPYLSQ